MHVFIDDVVKFHIISADLCVVVDSVCSKVRYDRFDLVASDVKLWICLEAVLGLALAEENSDGLDLAS